MTDEVAEIKATEAKEVAVIKAEQASSSEEANKFMETLDKLQEFKRFIIAIFFMGFFGMMLAIIGTGILLMMWRGDFPSAIDLAKWVLALITGLIGTVIGFYFGSNAPATKPS